MNFVLKNELCRGSYQVIPSRAVKRIVFGQALVYATHRQRAGPSTGPSTLRGRSWQGPSPILSAGFEGAGSTAGNCDNAARRPAAGGRLAGFLRLNLETKVGGEESKMCQHS